MPDGSRVAWLAARGVILAVAIGMPSIARAVNYTWDASGGAPLNDGSGTWSSSGGTNWLNANTSTYGAWGNSTSDVAFFGVGNGAAGTINVNGTVTTNGITFNSAGSGNYTLTGGTISIGGSSPTIAVNAAGTSTIASALTASSGFTKTGAGDLVTSGVITAATSTFNNNGSGTWEFSGGLVKNSAAMTLQTNAGMGGILVSGSIAGTNNSVNLNGTGSGTVSGPIITAYAVTKNGTGTWVLSGSNSFTGNTNVTAGVLNVRNSWGFGTQDRTTTVSAGAALELQDGITFTAAGMSLAGEGVGNGGALRNVSGTNTYNGTITLPQAARINSDAGTLTLGSTIQGASSASFDLSFGGAGNVVVAGAITTGTGKLTKDGAGTLTLTAANTYTGTTAVNAGTLRIGNAGTTGALSGSSAITGSSGAILAFNRTDNYGGNFSNAIGGGLGLRLSTGTLTLTGSNSYTGGTEINSGILSLGSANALGSAGTISFGGGTMQFTASNTADYSSRFSTAGSQAFNIDTNGQSVTFATGLAGSGNTLRKLGTGTLALTGSNSLTTETAINAGVLSLGNAGALGSAGTISFGGGTMQFTASNTADYSSRFSSAAGQAFNIDTNGQNVAFATSITGTTLRKSGAGTLSLSGTSSTLSGGITVSSGALLNTGSVSTGSAANTGNVAVNSGTYTNQGQHSFVGSLTVASGASVVNSGTMTMGANSFFTISGAGSGQNTGTMNVNFFRLNGVTSGSLTTFTNGANGSMRIDSFILGDTAGYSSFTNDGGRLTIPATGGQFTIGRSGGTETGTSTLTVNSGTVTNNNNSSFRLGNYSNGSNTTAEINLNGGLFETVGSLALVASSGSNNAARINFNGGTLRGLTNNATLLASSVGVTLAAGGGTIDLGSGITSTAAANFSGVGGFTKSGSGTLILTGSSNTNAGPNAVTGGILQIGDGSSAAGSLSGNIVLSNTTTLAFNSTATQAYAGVISGTGLMTKSGAGSVLTLSGNGSVVNGGITINSGAILNTGSLSTGSGANAGNVAVNSGTYTNQGQHSFVGSLTVASGASVVNSGTMTMGAGSFFTISGAGSGQNTGTMNVNFFRLNGVTSGSLTTFTNGANGSMTIDSFIIGETGYSSFTNDGGRLTIPATGGQFTIGKSGGTETGTSTLTVNSGTVTNNNNTTFRLGNYSNGSNTTAEINLNGGLFETVGSLAMVASSGTNNAARINFNGGTLRGLTNNATLLASSVGVTLAAGGGTIDLAAGITGTAAADMSGAGGLTKTGAGTLVLTGSNGFTGATAINAGVLNVGSANALAGGGTMSFGGGTLQYSAANTNDFSGRFSTAASQAYRIDTNGQNVSFANPLVSTNGSLVKTGGGTLTLANSSTTASSLGLLQADGGVLTLASGRVDVSGTNSQMFATNGGSLTVTGGTMNAGSVFWQPIIGQGSTGSLTVSGGRFISGTVGGMMIGNGASGTVTVSGSGVFESASPVAFLIGRDGGTGVLNLNGGTIETSGTLQGSDFNGATGTLNLAGGTLKSRNASNANWIRSGVGTLNVRVGGSDAVANSGAVFDTNGYTMGIGLNLTTSATGSAIDGGLVLNDTAATKGTLMLSGSNSYNGLTRLIAGTLDFNSINALRNSSGVSIAGGAGLRYSGGAASFDRNITVTSGTGTVTNSGGGLLTLAGTLTKNGTILRLTGGQFNVTGQIVGSGSGSDLVVDGTSTVTLSSANTYNGPTFVNQASNLIVNINNAIPSGSIITLGDATTSGTLSLGSFSNAIGGLSFGAGGGTLRMAAASTSSAPLTASAGTVNLNNGTLDLAGSGTSAGLYRLISAQTVAGTLSSVTGANAAYQVVTTSSSVNYQQRAVLGAVSVTNPAAAIITGGSAAFTYTVANNALSGGADLAFSSGSPSNIAGTSSGTAAAGGSSSSVSGLVFTGTSVGAGRNGTFAVNAPSAYGSTTASGTVSVDVYDHASGSLSGGTIRVADSIVGYSSALTGLTSATVSNAAGYRVDLKTLGTTSAGGVTINNVSGVAQNSSATISASVLTGGSTGANAVNQQFTLTYADDSNLNGTSNNLGSTTVTVQGNVYDHASGSLSGGTIRVADSIVGYSGTLAGLTTASVGNAAGYRVNLKTLGTTSAGGVSINNVSGVAAGGSSAISAAVVTGTGFGANAVNQQFTLTYADDSTLAGASSNLGSGTVTVQGNVYGHASGSAAGATIALADSIVGYTGSLAGLTSATISNAAGYRVNLMTTGGTSAGFVNINNVSGIASGTFGMISAAASLDGSQTIGSNALGQVFSLTYADNSALAGASSNLGSQSITVTGKVLDHATSSLGASLLTSTTVSLGTYNYSTNTWESGGATGFFDIYNLASAFGPSLTADLSLVNAIGAGNGFTTNLLSTYADIAGNGSQRFSIFFDPSGAQANRSTTFTISMSDKTGMAGATASNTLFVTANVIVVPEPGSIALAGLGIGLAGWMALRRRKSP